MWIGSPVIGQVRSHTDQTTHRMETAVVLKDTLPMRSASNLPRIGPIQPIRRQDLQISQNKEISFCFLLRKTVFLTRLKGAPYYKWYIKKLDASSFYVVSNLFGLKIKSFAH